MSFISPCSLGTFSIGEDISLSLSFSVCSGDNVSSLIIGIFSSLSLRIVKGSLFSFNLMFSVNSLSVVVGMFFSSSVLRELSQSSCSSLSFSLVITLSEIERAQFSTSLF